MILEIIFSPTASLFMLYYNQNFFISINSYNFDLFNLHNNPRRYVLCYNFNFFVGYKKFKII